MNQKLRQQTNPALGMLPRKRCCRSACLVQQQGPGTSQWTEHFSQVSVLPLLLADRVSERKLDLGLLARGFR